MDHRESCAFARRGIPQTSIQLVQGLVDGEGHMCLLCMSHRIIATEARVATEDVLSIFVMFVCMSIVQHKHQA